MLSRIDEIDEEIKKLKDEKDSIIENNRKNKISEYRNSIDIEKAKEFHRKFNELCKEYDMTYREVPYGYSSYESISRISDRKILCSVDLLNNTIKELSNNQIEDIVF